MATKKAQSLIVSSVLLILLVIALTFIIISFVFPFVEKQLSGGECLDTIGNLNIVDNVQYTCYDAGTPVDFTDDFVNVQVHRGDLEIEGFTISLKGAASKNYDIKPGDVIDAVMFGGIAIIKLPNKNEERTYVLSNLNEKPDSIEIYPILEGGKLCGASDVVSIISTC